MQQFQFLTNYGEIADALVAQSDQNKSHSHEINDPGHNHYVIDNGHGHDVSDPGHYHVSPIFQLDGTMGYSNYGNVGGGYIQKIVESATKTEEGYPKTTNISIQGSKANISLNDSTTGVSIKADGGNETRPKNYTMIVWKRTS